MSKPTHLSKLRWGEGTFLNKGIKDRRPRRKEPKNKIGISKELTNIITGVTLGASWKFEDLESLESLKVQKVGEMNPPGALYRRRKFQGKIPVVGSLSHRRTWGTRCCLEYLMRRYGLQSARNNYRVCEVTFLFVKFKEACGINHLRSKPHFSPWIKGKSRSFGGLLWGIKI